MERRTTGEIRAEGRRLSGTVLAYGDVSTSHRERFAPGALALGAAVSLNLFHDRERAVAWYPGGGLHLEDSGEALRMVAQLPPIPAADRALREIREQRVTGLSVEFIATEDRRENGLRVVTHAELHGIGLVSRASYPASRVEARQRSGRSLRASIPAGRRLACECSGPDCSYAEFGEDTITAMLDLAFEREIVAALGSYSNPLASTARETIRRVGARGFEIDIPDDDVGRALIAAHESAGVVARPFLQPGGPGRKVGETMVYDGEAPELRGIIVSSTDKREGWPEVQLVASPELEPRADTRKVGEVLGWL